MTNDDWREIVAELEAEKEELLKAIRKAEYVLRKDSLTDSERVSSARMIITEAIQGA